MKTSTLFSLVISLSLSLAATAQNVTADIISTASDDGIDLSVLNSVDPSILASALSDITTVLADANVTTTADPSASRRRDIFDNFVRRQQSNIIDVHTHIVPDWYRALVPTTGGNPTPAWNITSYIAFMNSESISKSIFGFSAPGPNVFPGVKATTVALARLMNEQSAAYARLYPSRLSFYAVVPLPYVQEAITEAKYAINTLGAAGIFVTSNIEGEYMGNPAFTQFFSALNQLGGKQILYIHPTSPTMKVDGKLIEVNPTIYPSGTIEFYFETARTLMDLTVSQTIHNFTNINYIIPHVGGAFPSTIDRILKSYPALYQSSLNIYNTRFWWDSAGPTYYHQVSGLLGYNIPSSQLLFGTDFPYAPAFTQPGSLAAVVNSPLLTSDQKAALFSGNAQALFGST